MEQKLKEKLDKAAEIIKIQRAEYKEQFEQFIKNMFTSEIKTMLEAIMDARHANYYFNNLTNDGTCLIYQRNHVYPYIENKILSHHFWLCEEFHPAYRDHDFNNLKCCIANLRENQKWFKALQDKAPEIIKDITQKYKDITETQSEKMDEIFELLDVEYEPTKHIKVTVEWI